jgi:hypothetical protein
MSEKEYLNYIETIINKTASENLEPYNNNEYLEYTKLNATRFSRWIKTQHINTDLKTAVRKIKSPQHWIIITEPWCGDAAHNIPFIIMAARENSLINLSFELRDSEPFRINNYLTNGTKSIPKLIIKNENGDDLAIWGPRPEGCQKVYTKLKQENAAFDTIVTQIQNWYNTNKGAETQAELLGIITKTLL